MAADLIKRCKLKQYLSKQQNVSLLQHYLSAFNSGQKMIIPRNGESFGEIQGFQNLRSDKDKGYLAFPINSLDTSTCFPSSSWIHSYFRCKREFLLKNHSQWLIFRLKISTH